MILPKFHLIPPKYRLILPKKFLLSSVAIFDFLGRNFRLLSQCKKKLEGGSKQISNSAELVI